MLVDAPDRKVGEAPTYCGWDGRLPQWRLESHDDAPVDDRPGRRLRCPLRSKRLETRSHLGTGTRRRILCRRRLLQPNPKAPSARPGGCRYGGHRVDSAAPGRSVEAAGRVRACAPCAADRLVQDELGRPGGRRLIDKQGCCASGARRRDQHVTGGAETRSGGGAARPARPGRCTKAGCRTRPHRLRADAGSGGPIVGERS